MNSFYTKPIRELLAVLGLEGDPREVEALMRCGHPTLDGLSASEFRREVHASALGLRSMTPKERAELVAGPSHQSINAMQEKELASTEELLRDASRQRVSAAKEFGRRHAATLFDRKSRKTHRNVEVHLSEAEAAQLLEAAFIAGSNHARLVATR